MSQSFSGGCWCGASQLTHPGEIKFTIKCYCRDCQHISGGGHLPQVGVARDGLSRSGPIQTYTRKSDSGNDLSFSFCGSCGSPLFKSTSMAADLVFLCAGALNQPLEVSFDKKVFEDGRQAWDKD